MLIAAAREISAEPHFSKCSHFRGFGTFSSCVSSPSLVFRIYPRVYIAWSSRCSFSSPSHLWFGTVELSSSPALLPSALRAAHKEQTAQKAPETGAIGRHHTWSFECGRWGQSLLSPVSFLVLCTSSPEAYHKHGVILTPSECGRAVLLHPSWWKGSLRLRNQAICLLTVAEQSIKPGFSDTCSVH